MKIILEFLKQMTLVIFILCCLIVSLTTCIQAYKCKSMTQTELFYHIPKSFMWDFKLCNP